MYNQLLATLAQSNENCKELRATLPGQLEVLQKQLNEARVELSEVRIERDQFQVALIKLQAGLARVQAQRDQLQLDLDKKNSLFAIKWSACHLGKAESNARDESNSDS